MNHLSTPRILIAVTLAAFGPLSLAQPIEAGESKIIIETNTTDGDVGLHGLFDADGWRWARLTDPNGEILLLTSARNGMRTQGMTERFFESSEPVCEEDEPGDRVQTLAEFLALFPEGEYTYRAVSIDGEPILGTADLTYDMPAAPDISLSDGMIFDIDDVTLMWGPGDDLGESCHDQSLIDDGTITDHADVAVVEWELVVEAETEDESLVKKFAVTLPGDQSMFTVPAGFLQPFVDMGVTEFKFEIGAREESDNASFSEGVFEIDA